MTGRGRRYRCNRRRRKTRNVFDSYSHGAGWGGQAVDLHTVIGASRKTATTARSSPTPHFELLSN